MTTNSTHKRIKSCTCMLAMLAGLTLVTTTACAEPTPAPPPSGTMESLTPMARLQNFTHRASELAVSAIGMIGIRYQRGGTDPENGLDCSGLVRYVFKESWNKDMPRTSREMSQLGRKVEQKDLQPGDLVFYNTVRRGFSHVGIYLGDNRFVHSPAAGGEVRIESMDLGYWKKRFNGARRIADTTTPPS